LPFEVQASYLCEIVTTTESEIRDFPKRFDYREAEPRIYRRWLDAQAFASAYDGEGHLRDPVRKDAKPFVIVIPPPNVTGRLHMGHALNNTVQDALIRYKRMDGFDALWVPGTDHAGIATQTVVKKQLDAEGLDFRALGREEVVRRIWKWKEKYGEAILEQLRRMGCSCDWTRTRFTMDEGLSLAVRESFARLYAQGLIYRGKRIVNWCPVDRTALSDDEVEKEEEKGKMYHIRYPFADDPTRHLTVATTRPETMFGDVAVAVNAKDPRYAQFIGRKVTLPIQGRIIPVIADEHADPEKGTGVVKITPAHDPNDFEVGLRHHLEQINVMNEDATMNDVVPEKYRGLDRYKARAKALEQLEQEGLLDSVHDHMMAIGRSYRSKVPIEFRLSDQWFVKMGPLAERALEASGYVRSVDGWIKPAGRTQLLQFHPDRFEKVYYHWLSNIRDWCISRQIWWGHRIPAWFHLETGEIAVGVETPERVTREPSKWRQDEDVLDTWFSSWLWPMSTLGWPRDTPDYRRYYPTSVLSTAKDILFFWVARMNFAGLAFDGRLPYRNVYLHSTIADEQGVTMAKSKGNGIDPLTLIDGATVEQLKQPVLDARPSNMKELINRIEKNFPNGFEAVGADAMRWTLIYSITEGENVKLSLNRFTEGRNFVTKLWNGAGRVIQTLEAETARGGAGPSEPIAPLTDEDNWLLARLDSTIESVRKGFDEFEFGAMAQELYHFVWDDFCSWALELSKTRLMSADTAQRRGVLRVMGTGLADMLRLLHPLMPFVTEELFSRVVPPMTKLGLWLGEPPSAELLVRDRFPRRRKALEPEIEARFAILQRFVVAARQIRAAYNIKDNVKIVVGVKTLAPETKTMLERAKDSVCFLAKLEGIAWAESRKEGMAAQYDAAFELYLDLSRYVDLRVEIERIDKELAKAEKELASTEKTLATPGFAERAPSDRVQATLARKQELKDRMAKLKETRAELQSIVDKNAG
jgi:valyl-tRNA synthetase